ncbi:MAG: tRNA (adenosine(37)-N6)-threonylcarbamoyltransferase complex ATPase subunit type 1 TsaE [Bacillota bacterium]|nr:tRNA (adenosine(37)-N6)-threonylcarbamoyltransferase complex ATPase subunit type 1 TsaE [Bacillota bacterium]
MRTLSCGDGNYETPWVIESTSPDDTEKLGELIAPFLPPNAVISLNGDLGAGKTALTRGLAHGLGCLGPVASPTFTLLMEHPAQAGGLALYHFDAYRLDMPDAADAFVEFGLDAYFDAGGVCAIEWGEKIASLLPVRTLSIKLSRHCQDDGQTRHIKLYWPDGAALIAQIRLVIDADQTSQIIKHE